MQLDKELNKKQNLRDKVLIVTDRDVSDRLSA